MILDNFDLKFIQELYDKVPFCVTFKDVETLQYVYVNDIVLRELNLTKEQVIGKTQVEVFPRPSESDAMMCEDRDVCETGKPSTRLFQFTDGKGHFRTGSAYRTLVTFPSGKTFLHVIIHDLTDTVTLQNQMDDSSKLWDAVANVMPSMFFVKDSLDNFRYVLMNTAFASFIHRPIDEILGKTDYDLFPEDEAAWFRKKDEEQMMCQDGEEFIEHVFDGSGRPRVFQTRKIPFTTHDGRKLLLGVSMDVAMELNLLESEQVTNRALQQIAIEKDFDENIRQLADTLRAQVNCDRVQLMLFSDTENCMKIFYEWCGEGVVSYQTFSDERLMGIMQCCLDALRRNEIVIVNDYPEMMARARVAGSDLRSAIVAPVFVNGKFWGSASVAFVHQPRIFSDVDKRIMAATANLISISQTRKLQQDAIRDADRQNQLILNNISVPIWLYDAHGKLLRINTAACVMIGASEEIILKGGLIAAEALLACNEQIVQSGTQSISWRSRDYVLHTEPIFDDHRHVTNVVRSAFDVTNFNRLMQDELALNGCMKSLLACDDPQKSATIVLQALCEHFSATRCYIMCYTNDTPPMLTPMFDYRVEDPDDHRVLDIPPQPIDENAAWYLGLERDHMLAFPDAKDAETARVLAPWKSWLDALDVCSLYILPIRQNGVVCGNFGLLFEHTPKILDARALAFLDSAVHMIEIMIERNTSRAAILDALDRAQAADKAKGFFLASMSHEIRTPLNAVIGFSELLKDETLDHATQREYAESIAMSGNALLDLVNDVLDLSKLEASQMSFTPERINFTEIIDDVLKIFSNKLAEKNLYTRTRIDRMPALFLDKSRIRQILFNIIGNAAKFTQTGGLTVSATFTPETDETGTLWFSVADTGCGIPEEDQATIFEVFVQAKNMRGTYAANQGTGLGLAIVRRMVTQMGGVVTLHSKPGDGTTVEIEIQNVRFDGEVVTLAQPVKTESHVARVALVVDDVENNIRVLSAMLHTIGIHTVHASNGMDALAILENSSVDVVLTDIWMPDMNGVVLAQTICDRFSDVPVIAVTADMSYADGLTMDCFESVLKKPLSIESLKRVLRTNCA